MNMKAAVHAAMEIWGAFFCMAALLGLLSGGELKKKQNKTLGYLLLTDSLQLIFDALAWLFRANITQTGYYMVRISNYMVYVTNYLLLYLFVMYVLGYMDEDERNLAEIRKFKYFMLSLSLIAVVILTLGQCTDLFYGFTAQNEYYRGPYWGILQGIGLLGMAMAAVMLLIIRKQIKKDLYLCFISYLLFPFAATVLQGWTYGISLMNIAITGSLFAMYIMSRTIQYRELQKNLADLGEMRIRIAVSQIGPHFLFNALSTIKYLCLTDSKRAARAVDELAMYFRGNLDAMTSKEPIPFEKEMLHVQHYLTLEKERFEDRIAIKWEIEEKDFYLPALTLQPMVENAVKHGILKHSRGGTVTIRSKKVEDGFRVSVLDDGVGFDPTKLPDDGRSHIGIQNVRDRLRDMCDGTLEILSEKGKGTECRIWVPKEGKKA